MHTHPDFVRLGPCVPMLGFLIPILQWTFPSRSSSAEELSPGHRSLNIQMISGFSAIKPCVPSSESLTPKEPRPDEEGT